jgi:hypothetical protein
LSEEIGYRRYLIKEKTGGEEIDRIFSSKTRGEGDGRIFNKGKDWRRRS